MLALNRMLCSSSSHELHVSSQLALAYLAITLFCCILIVQVLQARLAPMVEAASSPIAAHADRRIVEFAAAQEELRIYKEHAEQAERRTRGRRRLAGIVLFVAVAVAAASTRQRRLVSKISSKAQTEKRSAAAAKQR